MVDDEKVPVVVDQLELPAGQLGERLRGVHDEYVEGRCDKPAGKPVRAQEVAKRLRHLVHLLCVLPPQVEFRGLLPSFDETSHPLPSSLQRRRDRRLGRLDERPSRIGVHLVGGEHVGEPILGGGELAADPRQPFVRVGQRRFAGGGGVGRPGDEGRPRCGQVITAQCWSPEHDERVTNALKRRPGRPHLPADARRCLLGARPGGSRAPQPRVRLVGRPFQLLSTGERGGHLLQGGSVGEDGTQGGDPAGERVQPTGGLLLGPGHIRPLVA
ncbi:hypothetical protein ACQPYK_29920 [Streptosporangium sp. CA-135522]|uniref:hypothetical protein n=1 Tax=Streptosporangium sp. CA-135522 TaxID=3240072 RepID=UPI003D8D86E4